MVTINPPIPEMLKNLLLFIAVIAASLSITNTGNGQTVKGHIFDTETGNPLPAATILYEGTYRGSTANLEGEFSIEIDEFPAVLVIRYIGYESQRIELDQLPETPLTVELKPSVTEMEEIVVTDRDPGLSIMERVIARKQLWRDELESYEVDAYTRQVLRNDTSIVSITESGTRSFWDREMGHREVQLYSRQTTNIGRDQNFAGVRFLPNFYDDNITIAGFNVVGITHPNALNYYDFSLIETLQIDGDPVYKIDVIPKRRLQPLFEGTAYVLGTEYALLEVDLTPNDVVTFPPPIQGFNLSYSQQFDNFGEDFWLPVDMRIDGTIQISMIGLRFPAIRFSQSSNLSEYRINVELPDSLYRQDQQFTRAEPDTAADFSDRMIPLTIEESLAYETIDSTQTMEKAFEPEGFLARFLQDDGDDSSATMGPGNQRFAGVEFQGRFNRVDGFHAGVGVDQTVEQIGLNAALFAGYSFHAEHLNYGISLRQEIPTGESDRRFFVKGGYADEIRSRGTGTIYSPFMNSTQALFGGEDYFDYFKTDEWKAGIEARRLLPRTDLSLDFIRRNDQSLQTTQESIYDYSLFGWHRTRPANRPIQDGRLNAINLQIDLNRGGFNYGVTGSRDLQLSITHSSKEIGSDFDFTAFNISANWNMETFLKRRVFSNTLDIHLKAGTVRGQLPPQQFGLVDGSMARFSPFGTLKTRNGRPYEGSRHIAMYAEHNFRTVPFELLGIRPLVERGWGVILFGGAAYTETGNEDFGFTPAVTDAVHSEIGASLNSIFGILRLDFAKRLDAPGSYIGISLPRYF